MHCFPAFDLAWTLNWGRITNGERMIEDIPVGPDLAFPPFQMGDPIQNFVTPVVYGRWELNVNSGPSQAPGALPNGA